MNKQQIETEAKLYNEALAKHEEGNAYALAAYLDKWTYAMVPDEVRAAAGR